MTIRSPKSEVRTCNWLWEPVSRQRLIFGHQALDFGLLTPASESREHNRNRVNVVAGRRAAI